MPFAAALCRVSLLAVSIRARVRLIQIEERRTDREAEEIYRELVRQTSGYWAFLVSSDTNMSFRWLGDYSKANRVDGGNPGLIFMQKHGDRDAFLRPAKVLMMDEVFVEGWLSQLPSIKQDALVLFKPDPGFLEDCDYRPELQIKQGEKEIRARFGDVRDMVDDVSALAPAVPGLPEPDRSDRPPIREVKLGMTVEEVENQFGSPEKKATLSDKVVYRYPDMTVEFVGGRVSDVKF